MNRLLLPLALAAALLEAAPAAYDLALVPNGSFELDANRDGSPDGWTGSAFNSPGSVAWDRAVARSGAASVRAADSKGDPADTSWPGHSCRWVLNRTFACRPGEVFTLRGWVKAELTEGTASLVVAWFAGSKWLAEKGPQAVTGRTDWRELTARLETPAGADTARVYLMLGRAVGQAWFDDVEVYRGERRGGDFRPIDLRPVATLGLADETAGDGRGGWTDQGPNDARNLPVGPQNWRGIPFEIIDPRSNQGRAAVVLRGRPWPALPAAVEFAVNLPCDVLYFLHAAAWVPREGLVARYVVTLADGSTHPVPLRGGEEIADWWRPSDTASLAVGWEGGNAESNELGLGIFPWTNPKPGSVVTKVRFEAGDRGALPMLLAVTAGNGPAVLAERPLTLEFTDTTGWYPWAFALNDPTLAEIDLSGLLDAPAGKHGFLTVREDGHFYFEDGTRARFFGTNVGGNQCSPDKATAELVAERLSRYGINMLRLHAPDSRWSPLIAYDQGNSRALDPAALDRYDYFVAKLLERGIYVYFDLLDYRQFLPGDEVMEADKLETRWANSLKGASIFDERMLTLQKEFATQLLTHRNPYTGRRYVDEPGLAVQEITNENSLFYLNNQRLMLPSYVEALTARWNRYLLQTYGDRAALAKAWTNAAGQSALLPEEDPARGTVLMPTRHLYADLRGADYVGEKSPARLNALTRFLYELEADYYRAIVAHLRALGLKCPVTGTNQDFSDASNRVNATCDFTSRNNYWCHPDVDAKPFMRYDNAPMVRSEILRRSNPVAEVASSSAVGKPMIVPEFNYPWPNEWRAECLPLMACYGRLQDWDGLLYFVYGRPDDSLLSSFGNQTDPIRWGQVPLAALLFLRGDVETARGSVEVGVSLTDTFATRPSRASDHYSWYRLLPYLTKVRNAYFETVYRGQAEVTVASGHSASGDYRAARRAVLLADWPYVDQTASVPDRGASARVSVPGLRTEALVPPRKTSVGTFDTALDPASLPPGATPISYDGCAVGFESDSRLVMPHASALGEQDPAWLHRLWLRLARLWKLPSAAPDQEAGRVFRSDTGQLVLDRETGVFTANTPRARVVTGFAGGGTWRLGDVAVSCGTPFASISVVSLDSQPIAAAKRLLITAVARSENTGQATLGTPGKASGSGDPAVVAGRRSLAERGRAPVLAEPVRASVTLPLPVLTAQPLTARGETTDRRLPVHSAGGTTTIELATAQSPWVLVTVP